jgi:molybdopterin converting factor small subunit
VNVSAHFFAQLRDIAQVEKLNISLPDGASASDLLENIYAKFPALRAHDKTILVGVGVEFVGRNYKIKSGDEIAIMPPVQGG